MSDQNEIDAYLDADTRRTFIGIGVALGVFLVTLGLWCASASAQTIAAPTRATSYDWACADASGTVLSTHQRFDTAFVACFNNAQGAEIVGGRYRINRPAAPPVPDPEPPACPSKPADETRSQTCPSGFTGSWTQTRTYSSVASPTCWQAGEWLPSTAPSGACTAVPATPSAPADLAFSIAPNQTNPENSNVTLTWGAVPGAAEYEVWRCTGPNCTNFAFLADEASTTYKALNQPPNFTAKYRVRVWKPTTGPYSATVVVTTPTNPTQPPPQLGSATLRWEAPTQNTDGSAVTTLDGFRIYYGTQTLTQVLTVPNPALTSFVVDGLAPGTWKFVVTAYRGERESDHSNQANKVIP